MQDVILNTKNLSVLAKPVNDIIVIEESCENADNKRKLKIAGVVLGNV
jgi:GrpB-like predicted nucleotidyltransferase (UPF0157 family)